MNKTETERSATPCYVARKPCGCIVAASVDEPEYARVNAKEVAKWIRQGLNVDRVTVAVVRDEFVGWDCPHETKQEIQMVLQGISAE